MSGTPLSTNSASSSHETNAKYDFLAEVLPVISDHFPACPLWPSVPPRGNIYCEISALTHPLVSPAASEYFKSMPPMFFAYGEEKLVDEGNFVAQRASDGGAVVQLNQYNCLPHMFALLFPQLPQSQHMFAEWAKFCQSCVDDPSSLKSMNLRYEPTDEGFKRVDIGPGPFSTMSFEAAVEGMRRKQATWKIWTGPKETASL